MSVGRKKAPLLVCMLAEPTEGMLDWFWKVVSQECKILKSDVQLVYLLDEPPKGVGNKPSKEQLRKSWERFTKEIARSEPKVVMPLGGLPLYYLTGIRESIFDARGYVLDSKFFRSFEWQTFDKIGEYKTSNKKRGVKKGDPRYKWQTHAFPGLLGEDFNGFVIPSFDLTYIRQDAFACKSAFKEDVLRVRRALAGSLNLVDKDFKYSTNPSDVPKGLGKESGIIAVDIETHGFDNEVIDRVSLSDGEFTASLAWSEDARRVMDFIFNSTPFLVAVHNSPFDIPRLKANGVNISDEVERTRLFDSMFAAVTIQPDLHKGLGRASTVYLDCQPWKWDSLQKADPIFYSAKDAFITAHLAKAEYKVMNKLGILDMFMGTWKQNLGPGIMATIPTLTDMSRRGIRTNKKYAEWWVGKLTRHHARLEKLWSRQFGVVNPHSPKQLQELLYDEWELPIQRSKEGRITTDELALVRLKTYIQNAPNADEGAWRNDERCVPRVFDLLLKLRDTAKTISTYVQPVAEGDVTWIHPQYLPISKDDEAGKSGNMLSKGNTSTGRLATYSPNIGNQPKKVRKLYVPDTEDTCFIQADWKAAELVVLAYSSGDKRLINDLKRDMHTENAKRFGITRDVAKNVIYASQYLAGPAKVSDMILGQEHIYIPVAECKRIMDGLSNYYTDLTAFKRHLIEMCDSKRYIRNPFGRLRFFHSGRAPAAVDFWPQSTVADCLWCILKEVGEMAEEFGGRLTTTVYDSVLIQVPKQSVEAAARELKTIMERKFTNVAPDFMIPVEIQIGAPGASWGDLK